MDGNGDGGKGLFESLREEVTANGAHVQRVVQRLQDIVFNATTQRRDFFQRLMDPRRDLEKECGYPQAGELDAWYYHRLYRAEPVANRVVNFWPDECWLSVPEVYEVEDGDRETPFEASWADVERSLRQGSHYAGKVGSPVWEACERADRLSGVGHHGVLLLGLNDGLPPSEPVRGFVEQHSAQRVRGRKDDAGNALPETMVGNWQDAQGNTLVYNQTTDPAQAGQWRDRKLLFLRVFPEHLAQVTAWEQNPTSPRYGQPTQYSVTLNDPDEGSAGYGPGTSTLTVHWTRAIHVIVDGKESSEVAAVPRQEPVLRRLLDLQKLYGGSAEMYWQGAFPGFTMETNPQLGGDVTVDREAAKNAFENYVNGLQRFLIGEGVTFKTLSPTVVDPTPQIQGQLEAICIQLDIPKRIFMGSERGELSSGQDARRHAGRVSKRQNRRLTPNLIVPLIDRLIRFGVLAEPAEGYQVEWPGLDTLTDAEQADIAVKRTQALTQYVSAGGDALMTPRRFLVTVFGLTADEADATIEELKDAASGESETGTSPLAKLVGGITALIQLFQQAGAGAISEGQLRGILQEFYGFDSAQADAIIADGIRPAPAPAEKPPAPVKVRAGEALVHPETGATVAEGPPQPAAKVNPMSAPRGESNG